MLWGVYFPVVRMLFFTISETKVGSTFEFLNQESIWYFWPRGIKNIVWNLSFNLWGLWGHGLWLIAEKVVKNKLMHSFPLLTNYIHDICQSMRKVSLERRKLLCKTLDHKRAIKDFEVKLKFVHEWKIILFIDIS